MMCHSPGEAYAWIGSSLIHVSFICIIVWSATSNSNDDDENHHPQIWKIGLTCSAVYAVLLFGLAHWLETKLLPRSINDDAEVPASSLITSSQAGSTPDSITNNNNLARLVVSLTDGAAVISLGVPGCFVVLRAIHCDGTSDTQLRIFDGAMLGLVSLPVLTLSILLWRGKKLPSMIATSLIGVSLVLRNLCMIIDPHMDLVAVGTYLVGAAAVLYMTRQYLLLTMGQDQPGAVLQDDKLLMQVGLVLAALVNYFGACEVFFPDLDYQQQGVGHMVGATLLCFVPLAILGVATDCLPLSLLGAMGLCLDALRVAHALSAAVAAAPDDDDAWNILFTPPSWP